LVNGVTYFIANSGATVLPEAVENQLTISIASYLEHSAEYRNRISE